VILFLIVVSTLLCPFTSLIVKEVPQDPQHLETPDPIDLVPSNNLFGFTILCKVYKLYMMHKDISEPELTVKVGIRINVLADSDISKKSSMPWIHIKLVNLHYHYVFIIVFDCHSYAC